MQATKTENLTSWTLQHGFGGLEKLLTFYNLTLDDMKKSELARLCIDLLETKEDLKKARKAVRILVKEKQDIEEQIEKKLYWLAQSEIIINRK